MMYTAYKSNKQGDNIQPWRTPFSVWSQSTVPCIHTAKLQRQWGWPSSSQVTQFLWPSVRLNLVLPWGWWDEWDLSACFSFWSSFRTRECPRILLGSWTKDELQRDQVNYPRSHWKPVGWVLPRSPDDAHPPTYSPSPMQLSLEHVNWDCCSVRGRDSYKWPYTSLFAQSLAPKTEANFLACLVSSTSS